jgi:hypothetical protein
VIGDPAQCVPCALYAQAQATPHTDGNMTGGDDDEDDGRAWGLRPTGPAAAASASALALALALDWVCERLWVLPLQTRGDWGYTTNQRPANQGSMQQASMQPAAPRPCFTELHSCQKPEARSNQPATGSWH